MYIYKPVTKYSFTLSHNYIPTLRILFYIYVSINNAKKLVKCYLILLNK